MTNLDIQVDLEVPLDLPSELQSGKSPVRLKEGRRKPERHQKREASNYVAGKVLGDRTETGALKLKKLKPAHLNYISMHVNGISNNEIAKYYGVAPVTVGRVLADPLAKPYIKEFEDTVKAEFRALLPIVGDVIREGLEDEEVGTRLKTVDRFVKVARFLDGGEDEDKTNKTEAIYNARARFVSMIQDAQKTIEGTGTTIEIEATVVETIR